MGDNGDITEVFRCGEGHVGGLYKNNLTASIRSGRLWEALNETDLN
jgi:hypothetical protein